MLRKSLIISMAIMPMILAGCSAIPFSDRFGKGKAEKQAKEDAAALAEKPEVPAQKLLDAGIRNINVGDHKKAQKAFSELGKQHPFSKEAERSLVLSAFSHFSEEEYDKTVSKAERFIQLYPGSKDAPYMQYLIGESHFKQISSVLLDQEETRKGLRAYGNLVRLYPESKYVEDSKTKIIFMNDQLAGKEMQIGRYYQEKNQHLAAVNRFRGVAENFQTTRHIEESLYRLTESYLALGIVNEAQTAGALLGYNYPDSDWYKDAYILLTGNKLEPRFSPRSGLGKILPFGGKKKKNKEKNIPVASAPSASSNGPISGTIGSSEPVVQQSVSTTGGVVELESPADAAQSTATNAANTTSSAVTSAGSDAVQSATSSANSAASNATQSASATSQLPQVADQTPQVASATSGSLGIVEADSLQAQTEAAKPKKRGVSRFIPFVGKKD